MEANNISYTEFKRLLEQHRNCALHDYDLVLFLAKYAETLSADIVYDAFGACDGSWFILKFQDCEINWNCGEEFDEPWIVLQKLWEITKTFLH